MEWVFNDGGRADAGYVSETKDCFTRAIAIALELPYQEVYDLVNDVAKRERSHWGRTRSHARTGVKVATTRAVMQELGWKWHPTMLVGTGCTVHLRKDELPGGRLVVSVSKHTTAVIDGVIYDTHDCSRGGDRCVYGYWSANSSNKEELK